MFFIKHIHLTFVALSLFSFILRGIWMINDSPYLQAKLTKILPHIIDTVLLASAIWLVVTLGLQPGEHPWLVTKIIGLIAYIALGVVALKSKREKRVKITAWVAAIACFGFVASAAFSKSAAGFLVVLL